MHVREWLLEADVEELRAPPEAVERHVRECIQCRAALNAVLGGYEELDEGLTKLTRRRRMKTWWLLPPLAAAAALTLLLARNDDAPPKANPLLAQLMFPQQAVVIPPEGQQAIVMEKTDMTVVWLTPNQGKQ